MQNQLVASFSGRRDPRRSPLGGRAVLAGRGRADEKDTPPVSTRLRPCWKVSLSLATKTD